jgi:hypothetical protein
VKIAILIPFVACILAGRSLASAQDEASLHAKAARGDAKAQTTLGLEYSKSGKHVEAVKWLKLAAVQGEVYAQYELSLHYGNGEGVPKDDNEAFMWCRKAAEQGLKFAEMSLGICYTEGIGTSKDASLAAEWFRKAAEQGVDTAQLKLAMQYAQGNGVKLDYVQAFKWISLAAEQGNELAKHFAKEWEGQLTPEQRAEGLRLARNQGHPSGYATDKSLGQNQAPKLRPESAAQANGLNGVNMIFSEKHHFTWPLPASWEKTPPLTGAQYAVRIKGSKGEFNCSLLVAPKRFTIEELINEQKKNPRVYFDNAVIRSFPKSTFIQSALTKFGSQPALLNEYFYTVENLGATFTFFGSTLVTVWKEDFYIMTFECPKEDADLGRAMLQRLLGGFMFH